MEDYEFLIVFKSCYIYIFFKSQNPFINDAIKAITLSLKSRIFVNASTSPLGTGDVVFQNHMQYI